MTQNDHERPNQISPAEIDKLLTQMVAWERHSWRRKVVFWSVLACVLGLAVFVLMAQPDLFRRQIISADLLRTPPQVTKKTDSPTADDLVPSIGDLTAVRDVLQYLARPADDWQEFVQQAGHDVGFIFAMSILRDLELVEFSADDFGDAHLTARGVEWLMRSDLDLDLDLDAPLAEAGFVRRPPATTEQLPTNMIGPYTVDAHAERWYHFTVSTPATYIVRTARPRNERPMDTVIRLFRDNDEELAYDDDGGDDTYSMLRQRLEEGRYVLGITGFDGGGGTFLLSVATEEADATIQDAQRLEVMATAIDLAVDDPPIDASFDGADDAWYRFTVSDSDVYVVRTAALPTAAVSVDTLVRLFDRDQQLLAVDDDSGDELYSLVRQYLDAGEYYVSVGGFDRQDGRALLSVTTEEGDAAIQEQRREDLIAAAIEVDINGPAEWGELHTFTVERPAVYVGRIEAAEGAPSLVPPMVRLSGEDGEDIANSGGEPGEVLRQQLDTGVYLVQVASYSGEEGRYSFAIADAVFDARRQREERQQVIGAASEIVVGAGAVVGTIISEGGDIWYGFSAESRGTYTIETGAPAREVGVDTVVELYGDGGAVMLAEDDDGGDKSYSRLREFLEEGMYYIRVRGFWSWDRGSFAVGVSREE